LSVNAHNGVEPEKKLGTVRIAPSVLVTIVRSAATNVPGVLRMGEANSSEGFSRIFSRETNTGVKIEVKEGAVNADLYLIVSRQANMKEVGKQVQSDVSKAVRYMVGMPIQQINVYIQNVE
jgi:uncharacterized alkaline shock family protein YloU